MTNLSNDQATQLVTDVTDSMRDQDDIIRVNDSYYILATSSLADDRTQVLKRGDVFGVFDRYGDIQPVGLGEQGLYYEGTRFISRLELRVERQRPLLLSSSITKDNAMFAVDLANPDLRLDNTIMIVRGSIHIFRSKMLWESGCCERWRISNYSNHTVDLSLSLFIDADYADIFEVRGIVRKQRGKSLPEEMYSDGLTLHYEGLDGKRRSTVIRSVPFPVEVNPRELRYRVSVAPHGQEMVALQIACERDGMRSPPSPCFSHEPIHLRGESCLPGSPACRMTSSNEQFNDWIKRSALDMTMMMTETPSGPYPYAGVPWYCTVFGRDGIISAFEMLWIDPTIARGVLNVLAATQATEYDSFRDAEPGKIIHEMRRGEMANLNEIPFGRYYGSVDATPLFVVLAGAYYERTQDRAFIEKIWPNIDAALAWIDRDGDPDGDGFTDYHRHSPSGLIHQGWKDSQDSIFHRDGSLAEPPIALCEVQGYVYAAKRRGAQLAIVLGDSRRAKILADQAEVLKKKFQQDFWCEELGTYALALDGKKRQCQVASSNAGHCLASYIAAPSHAKRIVQGLLSDDFFSGWGIRTIPMSAPRYNPMSYHNGSVWPHDNALIAYGLARYRFKESVIRVMSALFEASLYMDIYRLPELFCGFSRHPGQAPTRYPVACAPQTWATGAPFLMMQACLGLSIRATESKIYFYYPVLPSTIDMVRIDNLQIGDARLDLAIQRHATTVGVNVVKREGKVDIISIK